MVAEPNNREARAKETRRRIFAAAAELFAQKGYHATTVSEIVERAGVAKGTFFVHFATKDAVVTELVRVQTRAAKKARQLCLDGGGTRLSALRETVLMLGRQAGASKALSAAVLAATLENPDVGGATSQLFHEVFAIMVEDAEAARASGLLDAHAQPELLARALMASYLGAALHFSSAPKPEPLESILAPIVDANLQAFIRLVKEEGHAKAPRRRPRGRR